jgi:hypothetical protein
MNKDRRHDLIAGRVRNAPPDIDWVEAVGFTREQVVSFRPKLPTETKTNAQGI